MTPTRNSTAGCDGPLADQFDDLPQQREAMTLGMWIFLATEVLLFGGLFLAYAVYRAAYPAAFAAAGRHLDVLLGTLNTAILLTSSLTMALAVGASPTRRGQSLGYLGATVLLGALFLAVKAHEYYSEFQAYLVPLRGFDFRFEGAHPGQARLFFDLYFVMTGVHALHVTIGIAVILVMMGRGIATGMLGHSIEIAGLYWHFVDIVWVFLFPLLYLIEPYG